MADAAGSNPNLEADAPPAEKSSPSVSRARGKDNARNGCRLEKGPISLQGHDPTTDLSFRNLRIAELPP